MYSPQTMPATPSPVKKKKNRLPILIAVWGAAIVVVLGVFIYAIKASKPKSNTARVCVTWETSNDGQVVDKNESDGFCNKTILHVDPQDGGIFGIDSTEPTHGSQVCSVPSNGNTDIIYQGIAGDSDEAANLCASMESTVSQPQTNTTQTLPPGLQQDGALETGCQVTFGSGVPDGATITLYNPGSASVSVNQVGVEWISNSILVTTNSTPYSATVAPEQVITVPLTLGTAISATTCAAGWN